MAKRRADAFLPVTVHRIPAERVFAQSGKLIPHIAHYQEQGVVRVIAGPTEAHLIIDVQRPYFRPTRAHHLLATGETT